MTVFLLLAVVAVVAAWASSRFQRLEAQAEAQERRIASLTDRIYELENGRRETPVAVAPPPVHVPAPPPPVAATPPPLQAPPAIAAAAGPYPEPARDLEALIGGNWLSKLGVLMLLIGVALFLGFSLTEMGAIGRVLTGAATSLALLGAGMAAERKDNYRVLGSALIGGGWAGLYFTVFAAHGIDASRIIESAGVGFALLLTVACGMILHSLRYRNQTVTGLAYMAAFLTIAISSLTRFSAVASIPLLLSLLAVAWKFGWQALAAAGALFAYGAYGFDLATGDKDRYFTLIGEPVLWVYWVILEAYDLAAQRRGAKVPIAPLNLTGFLFATAAIWPNGGGWQPDYLLAAMAAAQGISALLRGRIPASSYGGYNASVTFSALFSAAFIWERFTGMQRGFGLALLAEAIAVFGWLFRSAYLRGLGAALFALPLMAMAGHVYRPVLWSLSGMFLLNRMYLFGGAWYSIGLVLSLGWVLVDFDPRHLRPVLLTIAAGAVGLALRWRAMPEGRWAGLALALLSTATLVANMPNELLWVTIALPAALYFAFGWAMPEGVPRLLTFILFQFYAGAMVFRLCDRTPWLMAAWAGLALASWALGMLRAGPSLAGSALLPEGLALLFWAFDLLGKQDGLTAQVLAIAALLVMYLIPIREEDPFARWTGAVHGVLATLTITALLQDFVSGRRLTLAWGAEAFTFLGAGIGLHRRQLRLSGLALFALCLGKLFFYDFSQLDTMSRILSFLVLGCLLIATSWAYSRFREQIKQYL
ncbi:MAG: DUF2339 domain-containing protein [Bryobacterales bacterium]|nr:DUF2339 domain-containing protein [Bryobacterales bacterium]